MINIFLSGTHDKSSIFEVLSSKLYFPFGWASWDSISDCLRDLAWLPEDEKVTLIIGKDFMMRSKRDHEIFLNILRRAIIEFQEDYGAEQDRFKVIYEDNQKTE